jgi:hypothetical protein
VRRDGTVAADLVAYCDDGRTFAPEEELANQATREVTSRLQALGNQEAARKRRKPSQRVGAWAGGIAYTDQRITRKFVSTKKWLRAKEFVEWSRVCLNGEKVITRARFRSGKGFLLYIAQTYDSMQPHLKGLQIGTRMDGSADPVKATRRVQIVKVSRTSWKRSLDSRKQRTRTPPTLFQSCHTCYRM